MMYANFRFVSEDVAKKMSAIILEEIGGLPAPDRVLIISPKDQTVKSGGIILPGTIEESKPNKGVMLIAYLTDESLKEWGNLSAGKILTYGMYAGKEIYFDSELFKDLDVDFSEQKFTVLSLSEIIFVENNK